MIDVDKILVRDEILKTKFSCDLSKCKGACCTIESEFGAPLNEDEIPKIEKNLSVIFDYLPDDHRKAIEQDGFWEDKSGDIMVKSIANKACVFVYFDEGVAKCAIEKAYMEGKIDFIKPVSCHLFPIRITDFGGDILRYEEFFECAPALENGNGKDVTVAQFCKSSLIRKYGTDWYDKLKDFIRS